MKTQDEEKFHLQNLAQLRSEIQRQGLDIPLEQNFSVLSKTLQVGRRKLPNRFCVQPIEGGDALPDGSPGRLTFRRYSRFARGGFGLIWIEATAFLPDARSNPSQLYLHRQNTAKFAQLASAIRKAAKDGPCHDVTLILQLSHPGRFCRPGGEPRPFITHHNPEMDRAQGISASYPVVTDDYLDSLQDSFVEAAHLAAEAGFDGIDVKSCHKNLLSELLASFTRNGKYGGSFENRTRLLRETIIRIKKEVPELLLASRINAYDAIKYPYGFGVNKKNYLVPDPAEPIKLAKLLKKSGISILNVSMDNPSGSRVRSHTARFDVTADSIAISGEHPLVSLNRIMGITATIQKAVPDLPVVGRGFSWFRQFMPYVAAGSIKAGNVAIAGIGRAALAYPDLATDVISAGKMDPQKCCITCSACIQILRDGGNAGCVIRDNEIYGPEYRSRRHFALDVLKEEAKRCHYCADATCTAGCPAHIDIPAFIKAFAKDDIEAAYKIIRQSNVLPEMCSHLCPGWLMCEGACIETTLSQNPIRIRDIQYVISWLARSRCLTKVNIPVKSSGRTVAIIGGGPAGASCAIRLIEAGHRVVMFDRETRLGGTPQNVIRSGRFTGANEEIEAVLQPAIQAGRLTVKFGQEFGRDISMKTLRKEFDAVLLATGLWKELSIGKANGVIDALTFLRKIKRGEIKSVPARVVILSGGDSAMDTAVMAKDLGAIDLYLVYEGSLADMHWHMDDGWFKTSGTNLLSLTRPLGYEKDRTGNLTGLRICRTEYGPADKSGARKLRNVPGSNSVLKVDMVIEAMGLGIADDLKKHIKGVKFNKQGLIKTIGEESAATGLTGVFAAGGLINGGASVVHCIVTGMKAADEIDGFLHPAKSAFIARK